jgi:hypothetical protein
MACVAATRVESSQVKSSQVESSGVKWSREETLRTCKGYRTRHRSLSNSLTQPVSQSVRVDTRSLARPVLAALLGTARHCAGLNTRHLRPASHTLPLHYTTTPLHHYTTTPLLHYTYTLILHCTRIITELPTTPHHTTPHHTTPHHTLRTLHLHSITPHPYYTTLTAHSTPHCCWWWGEQEE